MEEKNDFSKLDDQLETTPIQEEQYVYNEETSAEIAEPFQYTGNRNEAVGNSSSTGVTGIGIAAIVASILSLFLMPIILGIAGIILGFTARRKGSNGLGAWAIGIGAFSIIIGMFVLPFF